MSKLSLKTIATGSGSVVLEVPPTNNNVVVTLPAESGVLKIGDTSKIYVLDNDVTIFPTNLNGKNVQLANIATTSFNEIKDGLQILVYFTQGYSSGRKLYLQATYDGVVTIGTPRPVVYSAAGVDDDSDMVNGAKAGQIMRLVYFRDMWRVV